MSTHEVITLSDSDSDEPTDPLDLTPTVFAVSSGESDSDLDLDVVLVAITQLPQSSLRKSRTTPTRSRPNTRNLPPNPSSACSPGSISSAYQKQKQPLIHGNTRTPHDTSQPQQQERHRFQQNEKSHHQKPQQHRCTTPVLTHSDDDDKNPSECESKDPHQNNVTSLDFATGVGLFPLDLLAARVPSLPVARFWDIMLTVANTKH
eukprot:m.101646 g.101646  ORF g.101646 m.101646 type:complete len:205 (+) comp27339_c0_seq3:270-884(+)